MPQMPHALADAQLGAQVLRRYETGEAVRPIAAALGLSYGGVYQHLRFHGVLRPRKSVKEQPPAPEDPQVGANIVARYRAGQAMRPISKALKVPYHRVRRHLLRAGVTLRPRGGSPGRPEQLRDVIIAMYEQDELSCRVIAEKLGVSEQGVRNLLHRYGVSVRPSGRRPVWYMFRE